MAIPIDFPEHERIAGPYVSPDGFIRPPAVKRVRDGYVSCWRLSKEERAEIQNTGVIWVVAETLDPSEHLPDKRWYPGLRVEGDKQRALYP